VARFRLARRSQRPGKAPRLLVHRAIHKVRRKSVEDMLRPCQSMCSVLERLRGEGVALGVVSNGLGKGYGHDVLEAFGLRRFFKTAVFREDVARGKPWPDSIVAALAGIGREVRPSDVIWYVGDQRKDIAAASAAGKLIGHPILPVALGAPAALGAIEARLSPSQIVWTPADFERVVEHAFADEIGRWLIDPLPAPLL
jgi:phosphoglycolate phosphatase